MKLGQVFVKNIHFIIIIHALWGVYETYKNINAQKEEIVNVQRPDIERKIKDVEKKLNTARKYESDMERSKKVVDDIKQQIENAKKQLPGNINTPNIMQKFKNMLTSIKVDPNNIQLKPGQERDHGFYFSKDFIMSATATWLQVLIFFENLKKEERIFNISRLEISRSNTKPRGRFRYVELNATITAYRFNEAYKEEVAGEGAPSQ